MAVKLDNVVPLGRSFDEYRLIYNLTDEDLAKKIVGVADGVSSFNTEMNQMGRRVTSIDPIYAFKGEEVLKRFNASIDNVVEQLSATKGDYIWTYFKSTEEYKRARVEVIHNFLADFERGKEERRYVVGELPSLDYPDNSFDLALSSHFLFFYSGLFDYKFHLESVRELARIAKEVRIFPLIDISVRRSHYVGRLTRELRRDGYAVEFVPVSYVLLRGANELMSVRKHS